MYLKRQMLRRQCEKWPCTSPRRIRTRRIQGWRRRIEKQSRRSLDRYSPSSCSMYTQLACVCTLAYIYIYVYTYTRVSGLTEIKLTGSSECIWRWPVQANRNDDGWQMAGREEGKPMIREIFRKLGDSIYGFLSPSWEEYFHRAFPCWIFILDGRWWNRDWNE